MRELSRLLKRAVVDRTGISGLFDIRLDVSFADLFPNAAVLARQQGIPTRALPQLTPGDSSLFTAVQKFGLKLVPSRGMAEFLVIDHIERPSAN